jgi:hypothetical protein
MRVSTVGVPASLGSAPLIYMYYLIEFK